MSPELVRSSGSRRLRCTKSEVHPSQSVSTLSNADCCEICSALRLQEALNVAHRAAWLTLQGMVKDTIGAERYYPFLNDMLHLSPLVATGAGAGDIGVSHSHDQSSALQLRELTLRLEGDEMIQVNVVLEIRLTR